MYININIQILVLHKRRCFKHNLEGTYIPEPKRVLMLFVFNNFLGINPFDKIYPNCEDE